MTRSTDQRDLVIDVHHLSKSYGGKKVVEKLDMQIPRGCVYGFLGPNGSGKTTTIRMLCSLLTPDEGEGTCLGMDLRREQRKIRSKIGYMTQGFSFYRDLTVKENLMFVARLYSVSRAATRVKEHMEIMGLGERQNQIASSLSGGWRQRLGLAAITLPQPELLLLDEPTAGVDPGARREFWEKIHNLSAQGTTVLVTTHYMDEAERCHRLAYIFNGVILTRGTPATIAQESNLSVLALENIPLVPSARALSSHFAVDSVAIIGNRLHVAGKNLKELKNIVATTVPAAKAQVVSPSLEDAFVSITKDHKEARHE